MQKFKCVFMLPVFLMLASALICTIAPLEAASFSSAAFDFEHSVGSEWSTRSIFRIGDNKVLGLFNDRNDKYLRATHLTLKNIPKNTKISLSFDLLLLGTWDSSGKLKDRWTLSVEHGPKLMDLTEFPIAFKDKDEEIPIGNAGYIKVGNRDLPYWVTHQEITISPDQIKRDTLVLNFRGYLTGRKTEFWALDNVNVKLER